jgi:hypothetical protein
VIWGAENGGGVEKVMGYERCEVGVWIWVESLEVWALGRNAGVRWLLWT